MVKVKVLEKAPLSPAAFDVGWHLLGPLQLSLAKARPRPRRAFRQGQARFAPSACLLTFASSSSHHAPITTTQPPRSRDNHRDRSSTVPFLFLALDTATNFYTKLAQICAECQYLKLALKGAPHLRHTQTLI
jgi:hypothetical protein